MAGPRRVIRRIVESRDGKFVALLAGCRHYRSVDKSKRKTQPCDACDKLRRRIDDLFR